MLRLDEARDGWGALSTGLAASKAAGEMRWAVCRCMVSSESATMFAELLIGFERAVYWWQACVAARCSC